MNSLEHTTWPHRSSAGAVAPLFSRRQRHGLPELTLPAAALARTGSQRVESLPGNPPALTCLVCTRPCCRHYPEDLHQQYDTQRPGLLKEEQAHHDMVRGRRRCRRVGGWLCVSAAPLVVAFL